MVDLNAKGGVLGQQVQLTTADDFCDPEQAVAAARKLVSDGAILVVEALLLGGFDPGIGGIRGRGRPPDLARFHQPNVDRAGPCQCIPIQNRDDGVGTGIGNYLADQWPDQKIAIFHDNTAFGKGIAEFTKAQLNRRGVTETIYQAYVPGRNNYGAEVDDLQAADIAVAFIGGYPTEIALMARAAGDRGYPVQLVAGLGLTGEDFGLVAGAAGEGALFVDVADPRGRAEAAPVVRAGSGPMPPFRCGRRRRRKPARWSSRR